MMDARKGGSGNRRRAVWSWIGWLGTAAVIGIALVGPTGILKEGARLLAEWRFGPLLLFILEKIVISFGL